MPWQSSILCHMTASSCMFNIATEDTNVQYTLSVLYQNGTLGTIYRNHLEAGGELGSEQE